MNKFYHWRHLQHARVIKYQRFFYPFAHLKNWNLLYGNNGFVRYQCIVPWEYAQTAVQDIFEYLTIKHIPCYWAMLKLCRDDEEHGLLSFFKSGVSLTLDLPRHQDVISHLHALNDKLLDWNGRLSLVSDAFMRPADLRAMYPGLEQFLEIKSHIDPQNVFQSSLARRLEMIAR
jgi:FAD/FMN-containing dehydrogenase